ncbi:MAG: tripartite tricarboxylate transporter permease [Gammaproteobacteria bacterium]|nr:tripartite tricarboxylate transporter permease [Gammaproteobacteria bacterium]
MENVLEGISLALNFNALAGILLGIVLGQILGSIPGLTAAMAVALLVPFSFYFDPWVGIPMMLAMFKGSLFGSSIPAILLRTPGTPAAAATVIDGNPLARRGKGGKAMHTVLFASVFGDSFSDIVLIFGAGALAAVAIRFGPSEYAILVFFALLSLISLHRGSAWKGIAAISAGVLLACIGLDPITGAPRLTFGNAELFDGIGLIPMLIGFLAISEVFRQLEQPVRLLGERALAFSSRREDNRLSGKERLSLLPTLLRSSAIGTATGALPGLGSTVAAFIAYNEARRTAAKPEEFGKGSLHGIAAPEAANNAVGGANLIPLLAFGIPGDVAAALILGALLIQGITPGPVAFRDNPAPIYAIFVAMLLANLVNYLVGLGFIPLAKKMVSLPKRLLFPAVLVLASAGAYAMRGSLFDVQLMFVFGLVGWLMAKYRFPSVLLLIGFILTPILERSIRQTLILVEAADGWFAFVASRPVLMILLGVLAILTAVVVRQRLMMKRYGLPKGPA